MSDEHTHDWRPVDGMMGLYHCDCGLDARRAKGGVIQALKRPSSARDERTVDQRVADALYARADERRDPGAEPPTFTGPGFTDEPGGVARYTVANLVLQRHPLAGR